MGFAIRVCQLSICFWFSVAVSASAGAQFLNSVIERLKREQYGELKTLFLYDVVSGVSRSGQEYRSNNDFMDTTENIDDLQNQEFQYNQNGENVHNHVSEEESNPTNHELTGYHTQNMNLHDLTQESNPSPPTGLSSYADFNDAESNNSPNTNSLEHFEVQGNNVDADLMNNEATGNAVPYYYYNTNANTVSISNDDALLEEAMNIIKMPLANENLQQGQQEPAKKSVEPLFVAMAGFVGIAMIFMSAVIILPKLLSPPPDVSSLKKGPQELAALTKLAVEAIEGNDCTERIACEVGRAMKKMHVGGEPIKIIEVLLPANMAKQLAQVRKALVSKQTCKLIQCKRLPGMQEKARITTKKPQQNKSKINHDTKDIPLTLN